MGLSLGNAVSLKLARFIISSKAFGGNGESLGKSADRARAASSPQATYPNEPNSREGIKTALPRRVRCRVGASGGLAA